MPLESSLMLHVISSMAGMEELRFWELSNLEILVASLSACEFGLGKTG